MSLLDFSMFVSLAPWVLLVGGFVALLKVYAKLRKGAQGKGQTTTGLIGFFAGIFLLIIGVTILLANVWDTATWVLLVLTGLGLVLGPLSRIPFGAIFGLVTGALCAGLVYIFFPLPATVLGISSLWIYLAIFLIPALFVFLVFKFAEEVMRLFSILLGSWPVISVLGILCILQGILLLMGKTLLMFIG
ncbi:MAG: hypothetical protein PHY74_00985 [Candidatus Bathyarchaeota archaeon]|nr:hypothetical protein [Candidatus Bathyarchaeota archaeon]MDD4325195.1 hypothetical protein [Candidatus Bathyarchaeota archaeon]MDI9577214.1 hypothetical protein [Thermoproteota archaeon]MDT8782380.1 hypothetical protein [Candidatus Bathyarchaeota archaeon]NLD64945.1 hypothetical protein [Thermoproteota archaeon]